MIVLNVLTAGESWPSSTSWKDSERDCHCYKYLHCDKPKSSSRERDFNPTGRESGGEYPSGLGVKVGSDLPHWERHKTAI